MILKCHGFFYFFSMFLNCGLNRNQKKLFNYFTTNQIVTKQKMLILF